jgi:hypothetical protein
MYCLCVARFAAFIGALVVLVGCQLDENSSEARDGLAAEPTIPAYAPLPEGVDLDAPFEALFCPDDPVITLELALIDRVREQRAVDPGVFDDGVNPYRIRYAVYNLRNADVVERLVAAYQEGVDVQVMMESDQLDPARDWNWADEALVDAGFEYVDDHRDLDEVGRATADLVGIVDSGLMHLKVRLFETPAGVTVLSGSMNPGDNAVHNDETLHLINEQALVDRYSDAYEAVLADSPLHNEWDEAAAANVLFTPVGSGEEPGQRILQWLSAEDELILLMVYSLRDISAPGFGDSLVDVVADRVNAGVPVLAITDRKQSDGYWDTTEDELRAAGATVWEVTNHTTPYTAMHHKVAVLGMTDIRVITDASNWTKAGLGSAGEAASNVESVLFVETGALDGGRTGRRYLGQFIHVLDRYAEQLEDDGEPGFDAIYNALVADPAWPGQDVDFVADEAHTIWGETIYARGDRLELGVWGFEGPGVPLTTASDSYPSWSTWEPASLPLGTPFEWKFVATDDNSEETRWEAGGNHRGLAQPPALVAEDALRLRESWRSW